MVAMMAVTFWLAFAVSVEAQRRVRALTSSSVSMLDGDSARLMVSNTSRNPVRIRLLFLSAEDFSPLEVNDPVLLAPQTSTSFEMGSDMEIQVIAGVVFDTDFIPAGGSIVDQFGLRTSLQVVDSAGQTQIFTDGFKTGIIRRASD
jgi:hypothetical protein